MNSNKAVYVAVGMVIIVCVALYVWAVVEPASFDARFFTTY